MAQSLSVGSQGQLRFFNCNNLELLNVLNLFGYLTIDIALLAVVGANGCSKVPVTISALLKLNLNLPKVQLKSARIQLLSAQIQL